MQSLNDFTFSFVTKDEFVPIFKELRPKAFSENHDINYGSYLSDDEIEKQKILFSKCTTEIRYHLFCKKGDDVVGWSWGLQVDGEEFYMVNSAVLEEYRGLGIYKKLLTMILEKAKNDGFQIVSSKHHASNNAIIIPKLKVGFKVMGMKIHPRFGTLIDLHYYTNPKVASVVDHRTGEKKSLPN